MAQQSMVDRWEPAEAATRLAAIAAESEALSEQLAASGRPATREEERAVEIRRRASRDAATAYVASLQGTTVGRCPFTSLAVLRAVDARSLAGPWWSHAAPLRPSPCDPATMYALTGALALGGEPEATTHLVAPGPGVPNVVPRLLERHDTIAVLASVRVGAHTAYVTTYFAPPGSTELPVANEWPYDCWRGARGWQAVDEPEDIDPDLGPWLAAGRLLWLDEHDGALRAGRDGCPFLDVTGTTSPQRIQNGMVW